MKTKTLNSKQYFFQEYALSRPFFVFVTFNE